MQKNSLLKLFTGILLTTFILNVTACSASKESTELKAGSADPLTLSDTDYSDMNNWLSFGGDKEKDVDVFVIYPTVTFSTEEADKPFIRLDSQLMRDSATGWLKGVEGVLAESANIYAPLYRQMNAALLNELDSEGFASNTNATPREDIFAAFDYFLTNVNKGERPFILFGHSQGAHLVSELATTFLGNELYYEHNENHIISYAIGMSIVESQIEKNPNLTFSESKDDTGVIVSWNTTAPSEVASGAYKEFGTWKSGALMANPISWEANETLAHASANKASMVEQDDGTVKMVEGYANAVVDKEHNVLVTTTVNESDYESNVTTVGKFHGYDIQFFSDSIKQNIKDRIAAFDAE